MKLIGPRTYADAKGRYWARFPVNKRYTWKLLAGVKTKRAAIAAAQSATADTPHTFAALAQAYLDEGCPTRSQASLSQTPLFRAEQKRMTGRLVEYFGTQDIAAVNDPDQLENYGQWRRKQFVEGRGGRAITREWQTLSNIISFAMRRVKTVKFNFARSARPTRKFYKVKSRSRQRMPESADMIHQVADSFFAGSPRSEVFGWMVLFAMFTGCRTSELLRLKFNARQTGPDQYEPGYITPADTARMNPVYAGITSLLHLERSKGGINPCAVVGVEFEQMIQCYKNWHQARFPKCQWYFPGVMGNAPVEPRSLGHAMTRACRGLDMPHITPHGLRAYYATKRRRDNISDAIVAAELGDKTVALVSLTYGETPGGVPLKWTPDEGLPSWLRWAEAESKIVKLSQ